MKQYPALAYFFHQFVVVVASVSRPLLLAAVAPLPPSWRHRQGDGLADLGKRLLLALKHLGASLPRPAFYVRRGALAVLLSRGILFNLDECVSS